MRSVTTKAIILGHKNIGEADKFVFLYTPEYGKIKVVAISSRKFKSKFTGFLETLNIVATQLYFGPKRIILTEIAATGRHKNTLIDSNKTINALLISEITNKTLQEDQIIDGLFNLIENTITQLIKTNKPILITMAYIVKFFTLCGLLPNYKDFKSKIEKKYQKFIEFCKKNNYSEIEKISLSEIEQKEILKIIKNISEYLIERKITFF